MKDTRFFTIFKRPRQSVARNGDEAPSPRLFALRFITFVLFAVLLIQAYHKRHWFINIPEKSSRMQAQQRAAGEEAESPQAQARPAEEREKKGLLSYFSGRGKIRQDDIFLLDSRLDSLFKVFNVEKQGVQRKIKNFPGYFLEEKVLLPRGKPLPEYVLAISGLMRSTPFLVTDSRESPKDSSVILEISNEDKVIRRMVLAYGPGYQAGYARLAVVLEGLGLDLSDRTHAVFATVRYPLTVAVVPGAPHTGRLCEMARKNGWEIVCQVPMESLPYRYLGSAALYKHFDVKQVNALLNAYEEDMIGLRGYAIFGGGIRIVENEPDIIRTVLTYARKKERYFLDNSFALHSRVAEIASGLNVPVIDPGGGADKAAGLEARKSFARKQIEKTRRTGQGLLLIREDGSAQALLDFVFSQAEASGIKLVTVSTLLL